MLLAVEVVGLRGWDVVGLGLWGLAVEVVGLKGWDVVGLGLLGLEAVEILLLSWKKFGFLGISWVWVGLLEVSLDVVGVVVWGVRPGRAYVVGVCLPTLPVSNGKIAGKAGFGFHSFPVGFASIHFE